ncbi:MAG: MNIO family bufferin maturase [Gammaproteobacteria bacterium]
MHAYPNRNPIPARAGIGLRHPHYEAVLESLPKLGWFEVHSENYFGAGGPALHYLEQVRNRYPLSLHGVGLSLGSTDEINVRHLEKLKRLVARFEPGLVSEHLCWSSVGGRYLNDLLPLPYTEEALVHVVGRIGWVQDYLGREILIENLSSYLEYAESTMPEWEFLVEVSSRSGCGILLDVNNIYVSAKNHGFDAYAYIARIPGELVQEIHLAGCVSHGNGSAEILIDAHSTPLAEEVWRLYGWTVDRIGRKPTLIEWDSELPQLNVLLNEAYRAERILEANYVLAA